MRVTTLLLLLAMVRLGQFAEAENRVVIAVSTALDGKGKVLRDTRIVVSGSKIVAIDPKASPIDYDLRGLTAAPIDCLPVELCGSNFLQNCLQRCRRKFKSAL